MSLSRSIECAQLTAPTPLLTSRCSSSISGVINNQQDCLVARQGFTCLIAPQLVVCCVRHALSSINAAGLMWRNCYTHTPCNMLACISAIHQRAQSNFTRLSLIRLITAYDSAVAPS